MRSLYLEITRHLLHRNADFDDKRVVEAITKDKIEEVDKLWSDLIGHLRNIEVFLFKVYLLHHIAEVFEFIDLVFLDASPFVNFR